ncbi:MAG: antibiotic biosynthesis monooxygenase [Desulfatitalea sp.]|nr:antibiotic biosynthesis monooxygenase [Desulfatitalea sp.]NNK02639.1 antibiotic biosynthesis monooxygenase [Desulfatitalea sp.]
MIAVKVILQAQPEKAQELEKLLKDIIPSVRHEQGTVTYTLHRSQKDASRFLFYEKYRDQQACDDHMSTPYVQELIKQLDQFLMRAPEIEFFEEIDGFTRKEVY